MTTPDSLSANLARIIKGHMGTQGLTTNKLAERCGIPQPTLSRRLTGKTPFKTNELDGIARELGLDMTELLVAASKQDAA